MRQDTHQIVFPALIAGALMLVIGVWFPRMGASDSDFYNKSVEAFNWMMRIGGVAMLIVAALAWTGWSGALLADAIASGVVGLALGIEALIWLSQGDIPNGVLVLIFALMFLNSARHSWLASQAPAGEDTSTSGSPADPPREPEDEDR
ncbi:MAG TPA: hypothetical protein PKY77_05460 [Phycisphaerae bacterium]|nr:hypothetical protein [Phycisphaerae bacterium]HRY68961.1 hypothetical protein [Phycisphaerae bacterium]HSA25788.1 hypothetical protein [Phycisphaerae bacterium]